MLEIGYEDGRERLLLWLPVICKHVITDDSPLASWRKPSGVMADADSCIVVVVRPMYLFWRRLLFSLLLTRIEGACQPLLSLPQNTVQLRALLNGLTYESRWYDTCGNGL